MMAVIGSALMNKILKLSLKQPTNSMSSGNKPNYLQILQNVVPAFLLLRSKGRWMKQPATISTISAFISTLIKSMEEDRNHNDQNIEINDYRVVDEKEDRKS